MHNSIILSNLTHSRPALMMMTGGPGITAHAAALASSPSTTSTTMTTATSTSATMASERAELEGEPGRPARTQCLSNILPIQKHNKNSLHHHISLYSRERMTSGSVGANQIWMRSPRGRRPKLTPVRFTCFSGIHATHANIYMDIELMRLIKWDIRH